MNLEREKTRSCEHQRCYEKDATENNSPPESGSTLMNPTENDESKDGEEGSYVGSFEVELFTDQQYREA